MLFLNILNNFHLLKYFLLFVLSCCFIDMYFLLVEFKYSRNKTSINRIMTYCCLTSHTVNITLDTVELMFVLSLKTITPASDMILISTYITLNIMLNEQTDMQISLERLFHLILASKSTSLSFACLSDHSTKDTPSLLNAFSSIWQYSLSVQEVFLSI